MMGKLSFSKLEADGWMMDNDKPKAQLQLSVPVRRSILHPARDGWMWLADG
jgi:hypothetical protein